MTEEVGAGVKPEMGSPKNLGQETDPFQIWEDALDSNSSRDFLGAAAKFKAAASAFFNLASLAEEVSRAYFEYSTLMDAYEAISSGRREITENRFDEGLSCFTRSSEILRSTIHFGYLAPYVSACASAEVTGMMEGTDPERLQGYRNAISLFEQSKIALGFQDESNPVTRVIDSYIRYCVSQALSVEALELRESGGDEALWKEKERRSMKVREEFEALSFRAGLRSEGGYCYLPVTDYIRVREGAFIVSYPDAGGLSLLNIGVNKADVYSVGKMTLGGIVLEAGRSLRLDSEGIGRGKIKVRYVDAVTKKKFDEGCLLVI